MIAEEVKISPPAGVTVSPDGGEFIEIDQLPVESSSTEVLGFRKNWDRSSHLFAKKTGDEFVVQRIRRFDRRPAPKYDEPDFFWSWKVATMSLLYGYVPIKIEGDPESERYAQSLKFYLTRAVPPQGKMSVGPMGLSSTQYNGHIFWDGRYLGLSCPCPFWTLHALRR